MIDQIEKSTDICRDREMDGGSGNNAGKGITERINLVRVEGKVFPCFMTFDCCFCFPALGRWSSFSHISTALSSTLGINQLKNGFLNQGVICNKLGFKNC